MNHIQPNYSQTIAKLYILMVDFHAHVWYLYAALVTVYTITMLLYKVYMHTIIQLCISRMTQSQCTCIYHSTNYNALAYFNDNSAMTVFAKSSWFISESKQQSLLNNGQQSTSWVQTQYWSTQCQRSFKRVKFLWNGYIHTCY